MSDLTLLMFGCAITFIGVAGAYVFIRERYEADERRAKQKVRVREASERKPRHAA